jgi:hypothetical protein
MTASENRVRLALDHWRKAFNEIEAGHKALSSGPASYYFEKLEGYIEALFTKYAPFQEGDRVVLTGTPDTNNNWHPSRHFLIPGAVGTAIAVDYYRGSFHADVVFDDESWIDDKGIVHPAENKHTYTIREALLAKKV